MPLDKSIKKVLIIGSGPIVIGQAAEFDYAGTQACRALKEEGIKIVLVNSNPATIMTDSVMADKIYIEPLNLTTIKRIIELERPDSILSGFGGQTGLTLSMQLASEGYLERQGVKLLGASLSTIEKAEDRQMFKDTMEKIGQPCIPSKVETTVEGAVEFTKVIGYPVIIRPAYTLGGSGGGIAENEKELRDIAATGLDLSPITQILVEKCISGWKEIEFEVIRDKDGNVITVCSMENFDPVGVHTGDSIVIAPTVTLADKEYQMLRTAALDIINELKVEGGCNVQFALHPTSFDYAVIEVNPRVSRSSALASKATGYPIAKVAAKIAIGYRLDEIINAVTGKTYAAFEPALDYVAVKFPRWPFDKFIYAKRNLGTQMKATGEVMAIADSFEAALMKAVRGVEVSLDTLRMPRMAKYPDSELEEIVTHATDERLFAIFELFYRGRTVEDIHALSMIDNWFLEKVKLLFNFETNQLGLQTGSDEWYITGKKLGYTDKVLKRMNDGVIPFVLKESYHMVDTCAGEFPAETPYFYGGFDVKESGVENEALAFINKSKKPRVIVIGSGPIRIGQGIEFDYACVHCVMALQEIGYEVIIINNNPETVSTDFDTADRLYFEPLHAEDVMNIIEIEKPFGVVVAFGGQTAIKLTNHLAANGVHIIGTSADGIDMAEDRERFEDLLERLDIKRPMGHTVMTTEEALDVATKLTYPVLIRPSYVLGGQNMIIAYEEADVKEYMEVILRQKQDNPVLIDKYLNGMEVEVDAICDGEDILIPGIMEHIERTGIHSGDSIAVYPGPHIDDEIRELILKTTEKICKGLNGIGLINLQYIVMDKELYVIEVNPRASRTVPYLSKVTGVPMCDLATRASLGEKLKNMGYGTGLYPISPYTAVKVPVFSFEKLTDVDTQLGPEMKSTGEVLGLGRSFQEALYKGIVASGSKMEKSGGVLITVRGSDKVEIVDVARKFDKLGFTLYATRGTANVLRKSGLDVQTVAKIHEWEAENGDGVVIEQVEQELDDTNKPIMSTMQLLESGKIKYLLSTSAKGRNPARDSVKLRRKACRLGIPCLTSPDTANALVDSLLSNFTLFNSEVIDINHLDSERLQLKFAKMQTCSNDYIYIDCMEKEIASPEFLSVTLPERHKGIGGDGVILIEKSDKADAMMRMFNMDGSEGQMAGNPIRCVAKFLYDKGLVKSKIVNIETKSGVKQCKLYTKNSMVYKVESEMGKAVLTPAEIPVALPKHMQTKENETMIMNQEYNIGGTDYKISCVSMGNPHCVVFTDAVDSLDLSVIGPMFEHDKLFPERVNAEFVELVSAHTIKMRVWERGNGETKACGTGACAGAVAAILNGYCKSDKPIKVMLPGGDLFVTYTDDGVQLSGDAEKVYEGIVVV